MRPLDHQSLRQELEAGSTRSCCVKPGFALARAAERKLKECLLELIRPLLPLPVQLYSHFDASVDLLRASLIIDTQLKDVAVLDAEWATLHIRPAQPQMVEEGAGGALGVADKEASVLVAEYLRVSPGNDLGLEDYSVRSVVQIRAVPSPVCTTSDLERHRRCDDLCDWVKPQRSS